MNLFIRCLRKAPSFPGKMRLARLALNNRLNDSNVEVIDRDGYIFRVPFMGEQQALSILVNGVYEPILTDFLLRYSIVAQQN